MAVSRRAFLGQVSAGAAFGLLGASPSLARFSGSTTAAQLLPPLDADALRGMAFAAIEAARAAGATYADVRASAGLTLGLSSYWFPSGLLPLVPVMSVPNLAFGVGLSVRALVDGAWGFSGSEIATREAAAAAGRAAATLARGNRRPGEPRVSLAPVPRVSNGEWATPIERDPFTVPIGEQGELQLDALANAARVTGKAAGLARASITFYWWQRFQVFASTEDTLLVQHCWHAMTDANVGARARTPSGWWGQASAGVEGLRQGGVGYEAVRPATLVSELRTVAERTVEEARRKRPFGDPVPAEVGRYDVVFSARAIATQLALTLGEALDLERALGYRANQEGTSFLAPPLDILDEYQAASPLVTVQANRTAPDQAATLKWDDEGAPTTAYPLIEQGRVAGYHTSRETAVELAPWFARRGRAVSVTGSVRGAGASPPIVRVPNLTLAPSPTDATLDDLIRGVKRGFYVEQASGVGDQQLLSNQFSTGARVIRDGKLGPPARDFAIQFTTPTFWRSIDALGGASVAESFVHRTDPRPNDCLHFAYSTIRAVPARVRQVNVLNTGRTA